MAGRRPNKHPEKDSSERWLLTYSDLITLLLIYFIVLFSMSSVNAEKFSELSKALSIIFSGQVGRSGVLDGGRSVIPGKQNLNPNKHMMNTEEKIKRLIQKMGLQGKITTDQQMRGLVISVKDTVLFRQGSADMDSRAHDVVTAVGTILKDTPNSIRIEGHTDNVPIHTAKFYSNWELSTARATNVLHYLIESSGISPERLSAAGYGEFRPAVPNNNDNGKAINRRVDIVVLNDEFEKFEPQVSSENQIEKSTSVLDALPPESKEILQSQGINIADTLDTSL
jgi:chemotaxis protein MotB